jgi:hypothetical protein
MIQAVCWKEARKLYSEDVRRRVGRDDRGWDHHPGSCRARRRQHQLCRRLPQASPGNGQRRPGQIRRLQRFQACGKSSISRFLAGYLELPAHVMASPSKRRATKPTQERSIAAGEITSDVRSPTVRERGKAPKRIAKSPESRQQQWFRVRPIH